MRLMSPIDSVFLATESREHPMHVAGLQLFEPPAGAGPDFVRAMHESMLEHRHVQPTFRKRPTSTLGGMASLGWSLDDEVDLEYHVRRSALPAPGRIRELLELTSRLHGSLLDRHRPLWETHLIEGLQDGRFAVYSKMHHALVDGVSALNLLQRSLSSGPSDDQIRVPWELPPRAQTQCAPSWLRKAMQTIGSTAGLGHSALALTRAALSEQQSTMPFRAPRTMFNVPIGGARRCAAQSWSLERIRNVRAATGATVNDVVLAMCAGALRSYLIDRDGLPDKPLVAMVPVNLRTTGDADGGNVVSAALCSLATDEADPVRRLDRIQKSMRENKKVLSQLPRSQAIAWAATTVLAPAALASLPGFNASIAPTFNVCISNVPGMREPLHWNGARLVGNYPMSMILDGQALNITLATSGDSLDFGLVGCRRSVPHLQRLLGDLETSLKDLERAVGI